MIRPMSMIEIDYEIMSDNEYFEIFDVLGNEKYIYLGDIIQMPGHCILVNFEGKVFVGYHTDILKEIDEDEA